MWILKQFAISLMIIVVLATAVAAQNRNIQTEKCPGPIYAAKDVAQRAKIVTYADTSVLTKVATEYDFHGTIRADAILCRSGRVTDIQVTPQLPRNLDEFVIAAITNMRFKPAESNWHSVSQRIQFEFSINDRGGSPIDSAAATGRLVEEIDIVGNRRMTKEEILDLIKTRPGDPYNAAQAQADLQELLKTGYFDKLVTTVTLETAPRGGVRVIFEVRELPLIAEIAFEGPARWDLGIIAAFGIQRVDLRIGRPFDSANLKKATKVLEDYLRSEGWTNVKAEASVENLTATEVKIVFKTTAGGRTLIK
jgi:hypothetical protein